MLEELTLDVNEDYQRLIKIQTITTYNQLTADTQAQRQQLGSQIAEVDKRLKRLRERYALEDIDREMYEEFKGKLGEERAALAKKLAEMADRGGEP